MFKISLVSDFPDITSFTWSINSNWKHSDVVRLLALSFSMNDGIKLNIVCGTRSQTCYSINLNSYSGNKHNLCGSAYLGRGGDFIVCNVTPWDSCQYWCWLIPLQRDWRTCYGFHRWRLYNYRNKMKIIQKQTNKPTIKEKNLRCCKTGLQTTPNFNINLKGNEVQCIILIKLSHL